MISRFLTRQRRTTTPRRVPPGTRIYAIGDVHGRADLLEMMHGLIRADAAKDPAPRLVAIHIGDYVDRGLQSRQVLDLLSSDPLPGFERFDLIGNHDAWMLQFLEDLSVGLPWLQNGGVETLLSYGIGRLSEIEPNARLPAAQRQLAEALPPAHLDFLRSLRHLHAEGDYVFVHAGIRPGVPLDRQSPEDLLWIREPFLDDETDHGCIVVHGHTICDRPEILENRIGIDTGAFATGCLTCLVLEGTEQRLLQT